MKHAAEILCARRSEAGKRGAAPAALHYALLPKLISGELRVRTAVKFLEAVA